MFGPPKIARFIERGDIKSLTALLSYTSSKWDWEQVRYYAIMGLGKIGDATTITKLLNNSYTCIDKCRFYVVTVQAVNSILDRSVRNSLIEASQRGDKKIMIEIIKQVTDFRDDITKTLHPYIGHFPDIEAVKTLQVSYAICASLGDQKALKLLWKYLSGDQQFTQTAATLLSQIKMEPKSGPNRIAFLIAKGDIESCAQFGEEAVELLLNTVSQANEKTSQQILNTLGKISESALRKGFLKLISENKSRDLIEYAVQLVGGIDALADKEIVSALFKALFRLLPLYFENKKEIQDILENILNRLARIDSILVSRHFDSLNIEHNRIIVSILKDIQWQPTADKAGVLYLEALNRCKEIKTLGQGGLDGLLKIWNTLSNSHDIKCCYGRFDKYNNNYHILDALLEFSDPRIAPALLDFITLHIKDFFSDRDGYKREAINIVLEYLEKAGDTSVREQLIDLIFTYPHQFACLHIPHIFGIYTQKLLAVVRVFKISEQIVIKAPTWSDKDGFDYEYKYNTKFLDSVIKYLCSADNPVAINLIHKIALFPKVLVPGGCSDMGHHSEFELPGVVEAREKARKELKRKGNPPYDSTAYQVDKYFY